MGSLCTDRIGVIHSDASPLLLEERRHIRQRPRAVSGSSIQRRISRSLHRAQVFRPFAFNSRPLSSRRGIRRAAGLICWPDFPFSFAHRLNLFGQEPSDAKRPRPSSFGVKTFNMSRSVASRTFDLFNGSLGDLEKLQAPSPLPAVVTATKSVALRTVDNQAPPLAALIDQAHPLAALIDASRQVEAARQINADAAQRRVLAEAQRHLDRAIGTLTPRPRPRTRRPRKRRAKAVRRSTRHSPAKRTSRRRGRNQP